MAFFGFKDNSKLDLNFTFNNEINISSIVTDLFGLTNIIKEIEEAGI